MNATESQSRRRARMSPSIKLMALGRAIETAINTRTYFAGHPDPDKNRYAFNPDEAKALRAEALDLLNPVVMLCARLGNPTPKPIPLGIKPIEHAPRARTRKPTGSITQQAIERVRGY